MAALRHLASFLLALVTATVIAAVLDGAAELFGLTHLAKLPPASPLAGPGYALIAWFGALAVILAADAARSRDSAGDTAAALAGAGIGAAAGGWFGVASAVRPPSWYDLFLALGSGAVLGVLGGLLLLRVERRFVAAGAGVTLIVAWLLAWRGLSFGGGLGGRPIHAAIPGTILPVGSAGAVVVAGLYAFGLSLVVRAARHAGVPPLDAVVAALLGPVLAVFAFWVPPNLHGGAGHVTSVMLIVLAVWLVGGAVAVTTRPATPPAAADEAVTTEHVAT